MEHFVCVVVTLSKLNIFWWDFFKPTLLDLKTTNLAFVMGFLHSAMGYSPKKWHQNLRFGENLKNLDFSLIFLIFWFCYATFLDYTSLLRARITWQTPDSCFSDQVELVLKKSHQKISSFDKVTTISIWVTKCSMKPSNPPHQKKNMLNYREYNHGIGNVRELIDNFTEI